MVEQRLRELLQITNLDHIAIVVRSIQKELLRLHALGWQGGERIHHEPKHGRKLTTLAHPDYPVKLELLEPSGKNSYLLTFLKKMEQRKSKGRIQHHITYYVKDLKKAERILLDMGFRLHYDRSGEFFIHMDSAGTLIQFFPQRTRLQILMWRSLRLIRQHRAKILVAVPIVAGVAFILRRKWVSAG